MRIEMPNKVRMIIQTLTDHGHEAYAVGGCVRDSILGRIPGDWDITTSAKPEEVKRLFRRTIDTGIEHGTVTIMLDKEGFEVTTYRIDGEYEDNRHPKNVAFTSDLVEDLKRRDFTINAMAYNEQEGIVDEFHGLEDMEAKVIRCVGNARERFDEDALRILRAIRFSAQLDFTIEEQTKQAITEKAETLHNISAERIRVELEKLLCSSHPRKMIDAYQLGITKIILPVFDQMMETTQNSPYHYLGVGEHCIAAVEAMHSLFSQVPYVDDAKEQETFCLDHKLQMILCFTMLLHDCGKPLVKQTDEQGRDHFYGHGEVSAKTAKTILRDLKFDNYTIDTVTSLIRYHDHPLSIEEKALRKCINTIGVDLMDLLFLVKKADAIAHAENACKERLQLTNNIETVYKKIRAAKQCLRMKDLAISGKDLIEIGFSQGKTLGDALQQILQHVLEEPEENNRESLIEYAKKLSF
ncbi:CCA tRNA nucleotidyltransferase [Anaerosporobacter faecicola]|uniref:CCA tRNA nucleotidyltransferase n=1 Tax=Anaerosporobacter faecicola TaxID=2718714 RepID=UPI001438D3F9|nr:CCA tRNA nucleotidyltransferase [Anaerosporobacter faecicola]